MKIEMEKLNRLAVRAKNQCKESIDELLRYYLPIINKESDRICNRIKDSASFECHCLTEIKKLLKGFDPDKGAFDNLVKKRLRWAVSTHLRRYGKEAGIVSIDRAVETNDGEMTYDIEDVGVDVESEVISREMMQELESEDPRNITILKHWINGFTNDKGLSEIVSSKHGGKPQSQRIYIIRFRERCAKLLQQLGYVY